MKTLAMLSQKGGSGKTTMTLHIATASEAAGRPTVVLDLDPQASATGWKDGRGSETPIVVAMPHTRLAAGRAADLILIPCRPGVLDLRAIGTTADLVKLAAKPAFVVLNAVPPGATRIEADAREAIAMHGLKVAPVIISERAAFGHALTVGMAAPEYEPEGKAASEVAALCKWLFAVLQT
jgi:chromosome partitioning protein